MTAPIVQHHANLEASTNVADTLNWKLETLARENLPTDTGIADYIAFAIENLEKKADYIKQIEEQLKKEKNAIKEQIERIKVEGAKFFNDNGIVKIEGVICSSITVTPGREEEVKVEKVKEFVPLISQAEIEELLIGLGKAEIRTIEKEKVQKAIPPKLRINKRKKAAQG